MPLLQLLNTPVTITRRSPSADETDDYGNPSDDETAVETVGELQQQRRDEPAGQGDLSVTTWLLILPAGTTLDATDLVTVDDVDYEVLGDPWNARNPRTGLDEHVEATLKKAG